MRKRILGIILCFAMCLSLLPNMAYAAGPTADVATWEEFVQAMEDPNVTTINVTDNIPSPQLSGDDAAVIGGLGRTLTITSTGGRITLNNAGIVLGGDVIFQNIELYFSNPVRNAIIANGYALTLENVTNTSANNISLFCGSITDYSGNNGAEIPGAGNAGHITVKGSNNLGNIYAGSLSDVRSNDPDSPNNYAGTAVITLESGAGGMGDIYAHGARENRQGGFGNEMIADAGKYKVTGGVSVNLSNNQTKVYGATGGNSNAAITFTDAGKGYQYAPLLQDIGSLTLSPGSDSANLAPAAGSSFSSGAAVSVPEKTRLDFGQMADAKIGSLVGGGMLVLGADQVLTIENAVTGTTKVAVGGVNYNETESTGTINLGQSYLQASNAANDSFTLIPPSGKDWILQKESDGSWKVAESGTATEPKVSRFVLGDASVDSGATEALLPVTAVDENDSQMAQEVPFMDGITVSVNGEEAPFDSNEDVYISSAGLELFFTPNGSGDGSDLVVGPHLPATEIPDGAYKISATIPGTVTADGQSITAVANLIVGKRMSLTEDMVRLSETEFTYNDKPQKPDAVVESTSGILVENTDYTVAYQRDGKVTDDFISAGTVTVVINGKGIYDGEVKKSYLIKKAPAPVITWPKAGDLTYGQRLAESILTGGSTEYGSFSWKEPDKVPAAGSGVGCMAVFTPSDTTKNNYETIANTERDIQMNVNKAVPGLRFSAAVTQDGKVDLQVILDRAGEGDLPGGTVQFKDATDSGSVKNIGSPVNVGTDGTAGYIWTAPEEKEYTIQAVYSGDRNYETNNAEQNVAMNGGDDPGVEEPTTPEEPTVPEEPTTPEEPSVEVPVSGGNSVNIKAAIAGSTATLNEFTQEEVDRLADGAAEMIRIDLSGLPQKIDRVNLPFAAVKALAETMKKTDIEESLAIAFSTGTVILDEKTMETVLEKSQGSQVQLVLNNVGADGLTDVQKKAVKDMKVYEAVDVFLICTQSGERISDFKGGTAVLEIPFAIPESLKASDFTVWYVDEEGAKTKLDSYYKNGSIGWKVGHFSDFVVAYTKEDNSGAGNSKPGSSGTNTPGSQTDEKKGLTTPRTGDDGSFLFYIMLMFLSCAGFTGFAAMKRTSKR